MAVQIRLMGQDPDEVAAIMAAWAAGEPVTVMADGAVVSNHRDGGVRMFGMAQLPGQPGAPLPPRRARAERLDRQESVTRGRRRQIGR